MSNILITGTSSGIGYATALAFARAGHQVFATMRNPQRAPELGQAAAAENLAVQVSVMDVDSDASVAEGVAGIRKDAGPIDVLVNNAGIERTGAIEEIPMAELKQVMETNYFGVIRCVKAVVAEMRARRSGCILNVSSVAGKISSSPLAPYAASKFALEAMTEGLAQEMKPFNVRVALIEPGIIDTPMARRIEDPPPDSTYPQGDRFARLFAASLQNPAEPSVVADKMLEVFQSGTWKFRHPVGPDANGFLDWRASLNDEEWVDWGAKSDDEWYEAVERDFGLKAR